MKNDQENRWKEAVKFSARERRALLYLLPVLAVVSWLVWAIARPRFSDDAPERDDIAAAPTEAAAEPESPTADPLFRFDPNTIEYHDLCRLGFTRNEALGIVKYRERGKVFEIPEDFASCYQVTEEMYMKLAPMIDIGEQYRLKPAVKRSETARGETGRNETARRTSTAEKARWTPRPFTFDTLTVGCLQEMGFSARQAEVVLNYRDMKGGLRSAAEFAECYVVSDEMFALLEPYMLFPVTEERRPARMRVNINTADSATLRSVKGIGEKTVTAIMDYRQRLGGFHSIVQLAEVRGMTEQNYERICEQIFADSCDIRKIDINFASAKDLGRHPYIEDKTLRKLLKLRQLKGGWNNTGQLIEDKILTPTEAEKLAPYLLFGQSGQ